jgi:hypothetical protein
VTILMRRFLEVMVVFVVGASALHAHLIGDAAHDATARRFAREFAPVRLALLLPEKRDVAAPEAAAVFAPFAPAVRVRWSDEFLFVESGALPAHRMMVGITAWQQQVPLPQAYIGSNAWRIPLHPKPAAQPLSAKTHFFRGAIALAANGVPIFNPIKNDGRTDTFLAGELDEFGGHAGRADDYHYHTAPLHLQPIVGADRPIAYALDGYAIYGQTEPEGAAMGALDAFNGHTTPALGYHYHATKTYPYINGGFHGEVVERDGQVDPQPRARAVREATEPLRGARVTDFRVTSSQHYELVYLVNGREAKIRYGIEPDGTFPFEFVEGARVRREVYAPHAERPEDGRGKAKKRANE